RIGNVALQGLKRLDRVLHLIVRIEISYGQQAWFERDALAVIKSRRVDEIRDYTDLKAMRCKNALQILRRNHDFIRQPKDACRQRPSAQMILRLAAVVVDDDRLAQQLRREHSGSRR